MKKILFPTDFSAIANNAFVYALEMADKMQSEITTLHVYNMPEIRRNNASNTLASAYDGIEIEAFANFKDSIPALREIAEEYNLEQVPIQHMLEEGNDVTATIIKTAQQQHFDLVVMGTKGTSGLESAFMGTKTASVLERLEMPVLSIPDEATFDGNINHILFTTDYQEEERDALLKTIEFAKWFDAKVHCVHFDTSHTSELSNAMEKWKQRLGTLPTAQISFNTIDSNNLEADVNQYALREHVDVIVMRPSKKGFFDRLFSYSLSNKMVNHAHIPTLSIR